MSVITSTRPSLAANDRPGAINHWTISPSMTPSPISGSLNSIVLMGGSFQ
ncbi:hypothetical protein DB30_05642 [Enhygromyxa salina]|uniref:Uncharacterized protein n=1 Tax=Enhygromyxa salina TaxID=215803 RepID=A0A0C2CWM5_9BACT|nr:hypothetical protein DB30_05642 [Enhygromyxa salina]